MPNYYAHLVFGDQVLPLLPGFLSTQLQKEQAAFQLGLLGPDPLLFYHPITRNLPRSTGIAMHRQPARPAALRLLEAVRQQLPGARGYAAGFLCHFALDSRCHLSIRQQMEAQGLSHTGIEVELDRLLMLSHGVDPFRDTPLPPMQLPDSFFQTVMAAVYPGVTLRQWRQAMALFRRACRFQTRAAGSFLGPVTNYLGAHWASLAPIRGFLLSRSPAPAYAQAARQLHTLLKQEAAPTAHELEHFFAAANGESQLGSWYDRTFGGQETLPETPRHLK